MCSSDLSEHFAVWVTVWVRPVDPDSNPHEISQNCNKNSRNPVISGVFWSCWADSNRRPHPYQLIAHPRNASIWQFGGIFVPEKRRQWCFPLHCLRPLISYCGSGCGSGPIRPQSSGHRFPTSTESTLNWSMSRPIPQANHTQNLHRCKQIGRAHV